MNDLFMSTETTNLIIEKAKNKVQHTWNKKWQPEMVEAILNDFINEL